MIDVDAGNGRNRRQVPVVDLERNQADEEIILVGEKRKKSNRSNRCSNKKRKINLDDDTSVDPLHLFEEKEREFQRIRRNFPTTNPLIFLPFDIIEHVCHYLNLRDFVHLLCISKAWRACREVLPWKDLSARMFDVMLLMRHEGTWLERLKFKCSLDRNWKNGTKVDREFKVYCAKFIQLPSETIIYETRFTEESATFYKVIGTKIEKIFDSVYNQASRLSFTLPAIFLGPIHVFEADNKILGLYESDREWKRMTDRTISKWNLASSDRQLSDQNSLEDIFNKKVIVHQFEDASLYGGSLHVESDTMAAYISNRSAFVIDKISTSQLILETEPLTVPSSQFYHINGDFILYTSVADRQLMILNWRTNELSNLEVVTKGYDSVALALPMGAINANNNCAYSLYTDTNWLILINLTNGTIDRHYEKPAVRFRPSILKLWPEDKTRFFTLGSTLHVWSLFKSSIIDCIIVHPVHPLKTTEPFPLHVKFFDNKILVEYSATTYILMKTSNGSYDVIQRFSNCTNFDECYLYSHNLYEYNTVLVSDFTPTLSTNNTNTNQPNTNSNNDVIPVEVID